MERSRGGRPRHPDILTLAEHRVLDELRAGGTNAEIAERLGIGAETVKTHISTMLSKLDLPDRQRLAAWREPPRERRRRWLFAPLAVPFPLKVAGGAVAVAGIVVAVLLTLPRDPDPADDAPVATVPAAATATATPMPAAMVTPNVDAPAVSVGLLHTCALRASGEVACWGDNGFGQTNAPAGTFRSVSVGVLHTCALRESGEVACWGRQRVRPNERARRNLPLHQRGQGAHLRLARVRRSGLLGRQRARPNERARRNLPLRERGRGFQLRAG